MTTLTLTLLEIVRIMITGCREIIFSLACSKKIEIWFGLVLKRKTVQHFKKLAKFDIWPSHIWAFRLKNELR
jgi:hypothetical protein